MTCLFEKKLDKEKGLPRSPSFARLARHPAYFKGSWTRRKGCLARLASLGSLGALPISKEAGQGERVASLASLRSARSAPCLLERKSDQLLTSLGKNEIKNRGQCRREIKQKQREAAGGNGRQRWRSRIRGERNQFLRLRRGPERASFDCAKTL